MSDVETKYCYLSDPELVEWLDTVADVLGDVHGLRHYAATVREAAGRITSLSAARKAAYESGLLDAAHPAFCRDCD